MTAYSLWDEVKDREPYFEGLGTGWNQSGPGTGNQMHVSLLSRLDQLPALQHIIKLELLTTSSWNCEMWVRLAKRSLAQFYYRALHGTMSSQSYFQQWRWCKSWRAYFNQKKTWDRRACISSVPWFCHLMPSISQFKLIDNEHEQQCTVTCVFTEVLRKTKDLQCQFSKCFGDFGWRLDDGF